MLGMEWPTVAPGGLNRYLADLGQALEGRGVAVEKVVAGLAPPGVTGAGTLRQPLPARALRYWVAARPHLSRADLVDAHFAPYALLSVALPGRPRCPLVVHFQGPWAEESAVEGQARWAVALKARVERAVYRRADLVVTLSGAFRRIAVERYGVSPWATRVMPPGVDLEAFSPGDRLRAREALGLGPRQHVVVSVRRLAPRMGLDDLLEAWAKAVPELDDPVLLVVGEGPLRAELEARARILSVTNRVRFLGRVADATLVNCFRAADLSVVPSRALEGYGLVVLESLACGTPVIATDTGGLPEALAGLPGHLTVPARDPGALAQALLDALRDPSGRADPGACRRQAEAHSWDGVAGAHLDAYRRVLQGGERKLRVVYLDHCARPSGGELALARLLPALEGVEPHVVLAEEGPLVGILHQAGVSVEVLPMAEGARRLSRDRVRPGRVGGAAVGAASAYVLRLARRLRTLRPDLVHTNSLKAAVYGALAARLAGVPVVWHIRDRVAPDYLPAPAVAALRGLARVLPSHVIANSQATLACLPVAEGRASVVPSPVELPREAPIAGEALMPRAGGPLTVGMVGRLAPWKGQDLFLRAFATAFPDGPERAVLVGEALFGEDDYAGELRSLSARLGLEGRVDWRGFRADVGAELRGLDVLVHASVVPEPFGQVVVEGMAAGLPVVAAGAGGPAETVTDGVDGLLYPPGDVGALAERLRLLASDPDLRARLGRAGARRAQAFSAEALAPLVLHAYQQVCPSLLGRGADHGGSQP